MIQPVRCSGLFQNLRNSRATRRRERQPNAMSKDVIELPPARLDGSPSRYVPRGLSESDRRGQQDLIQWAEALRSPQGPPAEPPKSPRQIEIEEAVKALTIEGHEHITEELVQEWLRKRRNANQPPEAVGEPLPAQPPPKPKRSRGRPPKTTPWLAWAAELYAEGYSLRRALKKLGLSLTVAERKGIYRLKRFRQLVAEHRGKYGMR